MIIDTNGCIIRDSLQPHPDEKARTETCHFQTGVFLESDCDSLCQHYISPKTNVAFEVARSDGEVFLKVLYFKMNDYEKSLVKRAVLHTLSAVEMNATVHDSKAGGRYIVAGWGCMTKKKQQPMVQDPKSQKNINIPYLRHPLGFKKSHIMEQAIQDVARLMGCCAEKVGICFPEVTDALAYKARFREVTGAFFQYPSHSQQQLGGSRNDTCSGSLGCHQLGIRLSGKTIMPSKQKHQCLNSLCGVHLDSHDGKRKFGVPLIYAPYLEVGTDLLPDESDALMPQADLVVSSKADGYVISPPFVMSYVISFLISCFGSSNTSLMLIVLVEVASGLKHAVGVTSAWLCLTAVSMFMGMFFQTTSQAAHL